MGGEGEGKRKWRGRGRVWTKGQNSWVRKCVGNM